MFSSSDTNHDAAEIMELQAHLSAYPMILQTSEKLSIILWIPEPQSESQAPWAYWWVPRILVYTHLCSAIRIPLCQRKNWRLNVEFMDPWLVVLKKKKRMSFDQKLCNSLNFLKKNQSKNSTLMFTILDTIAHCVLNIARCSNLFFSVFFLLMFVGLEWVFCFS